jgi:general secretion pathway protein L
VLAAAAIALPFILQSIALTRIDARIEAVKPQVAAIEKVRKQIATTAAAGDVILAARKQVGSPLQSIALVTEALPDDTYVTTLSLRERKVSVSGLHRARRAR